MDLNNNQKKSKKLAYWLLVCSFMVFLMVFVGGITRLTESGLSMTSWHPINEVIPPLNEEEWHAEFENYKQSPEYLKKNFGMELEEFKEIFFWEWFHRVLGRVVGLVFFIPFMYFLITKEITGGKNIIKYFSLFLLGGAQGLLGWWMVKSGLVDRPDVSHFRLATHLSLALILLSFLFYFALSNIYETVNIEGIGKVNKFAKITYLVLFIQIVFGAFMAGLNGGMVYNTWPKMNDNFIALEAFSSTNAILEDIATIQFIHRWWAFVVLVFVGILYSLVKRGLKYSNTKEGIYKKLKNSVFLLKFLLLVQIILGIFTLIHQVPVSLASAHQITAVLMLLNIVFIIRLTNAK